MIALTLTLLCFEVLIITCRSIFFVPSEVLRTIIISCYRGLISPSFYQYSVNYFDVHLLRPKQSKQYV